MATDTYILANPTPAPIATGAPASLSLETALATTAAITELNLEAGSGTINLQVNDFIVLKDGANIQVFVVTAATAVAESAVEVPVVSQTPNYAYPASGSTVVTVPGRGAGTAVAPGEVAIVTITETASPLEAFVSQGGIAAPGALTGNTAGTVVDQIDNLTQLIEKGAFNLGALVRPVISAAGNTQAEAGV